MRAVGRRAVAAAQCVHGPLRPRAHAVDYRHWHQRGDVRSHAGQPRAAEDHRLHLEALRGLAAGLGQQHTGAGRIGGQLCAARRDGVDAGQRLRVPQRARKPRQHRSPALAAGDDRKTAVPGRLGEGRFRQTVDRHARTFAHGEDARVAEAGHQNRIGPVRRFRHRRGPGIEHGVTRDGITRFGRDVRRPETRRHGLHVERRTCDGLDMALEHRRDRRRGVGVDDEQPWHPGFLSRAKNQRRWTARRRSRATAPSATPITTSETIVVTVPSA